jgi:Putative zinc-finger
MDLKCEEVWREISNYIDNELEVSLRADIDRHLAGCSRCSAVLAGTKNIVQLYGDERMFDIPAEFSPTLHRRLAMQARPERGAAYTWILSLAGAGLVAAAMIIFSLPRFAVPTLRAPMSEPALRAPVANLVVVSDDGKTFHVPGCTYIHGKWRMMPVEEAMKEGYNPCIRCEAGLIHRTERSRAPSAIRAAEAEEPGSGD